MPYDEQVFCHVFCLVERWNMPQRYITILVQAVAKWLSSVLFDSSDFTVLPFDDHYAQITDWFSCGTNRGIPGSGRYFVPMDHRFWMDSLFLEMTDCFLSHTIVWSIVRIDGSLRAFTYCPRLFRCCRQVARSPNGVYCLLEAQPFYSEKR